MHPRTVRLNVGVLYPPRRFTVSEMIEGMRAVYGQAGIDVEVSEERTLLLPALVDVDVGECIAGVVTEEQAELFAYRGGAAPNDICIYFVRSTVQAYSGCASHPPGRPSAIVAGASRWTLAHEVGHVLGLRHVDDRTRLMTGGGTSAITISPPRLAPSEVATLRASPFLY